MKRKKRRQKRVQRPACRIVTSGDEVIGIAAAEVAETACVVGEEEVVALNCEDGLV
jgi:hypothetical protein